MFQHNFLVVVRLQTLLQIDTSQTKNTNDCSRHLFPVFRKTIQIKPTLAREDYWLELFDSFVSPADVLFIYFIWTLERTSFSQICNLLIFNRVKK